MSYRKRLVIFFSIIVFLAIILVTFFVIDTKSRFKNINKEEFIPQEAGSIFKNTSDE